MPPFALLPPLRLGDDKLTAPFFGMVSDSNRPIAGETASEATKHFPQRIRMMEISRHCVIKCCDHVRLCTARCDSSTEQTPGRREGQASSNAESSMQEAAIIYRVGHGIARLALPSLPHLSAAASQSRLEATSSPARAPLSLVYSNSKKLQRHLRFSSSMSGVSDRNHRQRQQIQEMYDEMRGQFPEACRLRSLYCI